MIIFLVIVAIVLTVLFALKKKCVEAEGCAGPSDREADRDSGRTRTRASYLDAAYIVDDPGSEKK